MAQRQVRIKIKWKDIGYFKSQLQACANISAVTILFKDISSGFNDGLVEVIVWGDNQGSINWLFDTLLVPLSQNPTKDSIIYYSLSYRDSVRRWLEAERMMPRLISRSFFFDLDIFEFRISPLLELAFNYIEEARWLTIYWEPAIGDAVCNDGRSVTISSNVIWGKFLAENLTNFKLGSYDDSNCKDCLLFDRGNRRLYLGSWVAVHHYLEQPDKLELLELLEEEIIVPARNNSYKDVIWGRIKFAVALAQLITVVVAAASAIAIPLGVGADCIWQINKPSQIISPALTASVNQEMTRAILIATGLGFIAFKLSKQREQD